MKKALLHTSEITKKIERAGSFILMLDFDGTLAPIASQPEKAQISERSYATLEALKLYSPIAIISGRQLDDVIQKVGIANIAYAGNHGFEWKMDFKRHAKKIPQQEIHALGRAQKDLQMLEARFHGLRIENKKYTLAIHFRSVKKKLLDKLRNACSEILNPYVEKKLILCSKVGVFSTSHRISIGTRVRAHACFITSSLKATKLSQSPYL